MGSEEESLSALMGRTQDMAPEPLPSTDQRGKPLPKLSVCCNGCGQEVIAYISALEKRYHPSCFRCIGCHEIINPSLPFSYVYDSVFHPDRKAADSTEPEPPYQNLLPPGMGSLIMCQSTSESTTEKCSFGNNAETIKQNTPDPAVEKLPLHSHCHAELFGIKCCVCDETIPSDPVTHRVAYIRHPFFENQKVCPSHLTSNTRRCTGCHQFEPSSRDRGFADIGDADRCICMSCCRTVISDHESAMKKYESVIAFMEHTLGLQIWEGMRNIPILVVNSSDLYDAQNISSAHRGSTQIMTRGMCLSEHSEVINESSNRVESSISITAILCLSGLPTDLMSSVLAHEATHAWFKLHPQYDAHEPISKVAEEGCCQLLAMLLLTEGLSECIHGTEGPQDGPNDDKLRQYFRFCIETENDDVYGTGYRIAAQVYSAIGIHALLEHVVECKTLPCFTT